IREKIQLFARGAVVRLCSAHGVSEQGGRNTQRLRQLGPSLNDLRIRLPLGRFSFLACPFFQTEVLRINDETGIQKMQRVTGVYRFSIGFEQRLNERSGGSERGCSGGRRAY